MAFDDSMAQVFEKLSGLYQRQFGVAGNGKGQLLFPHGLAVDGKHVYVAEKGNHRVQVRRRAYFYQIGYISMSVVAGFFSPPRQ